MIVGGNMAQQQENSIMMSLKAHLSLSMLMLLYVILENHLSSIKCERNLIPGHSCIHVMPLDWVILFDIMFIPGTEIPP